MNSPLNRFLDWEKKVPNDVFLRQPFNGVWKSWTWAEAGNEARKIAKGLQSIGLVPGDHVALLSKNCAQWIIADLAIMMNGCISIPIYPTLTSHSILPILQHSDSKAIFLGKLDDFTTQKDGIPENMEIISMGTYGLHEGNSWEEMLASQTPIETTHHWNSDDIFTIIYTSGTTGKSKGVMHAVDNFEQVGTVITSEIKIPQRLELFSYLPLSHIAERMAVEMNGIFNGARISFAESLESFPKNLMDTQPTIFFAVPRIWGKLREGILKKMPQKKLDMFMAIPILNSIIKKGIKKKLGLSNAYYIVSAAAPLSVDLLNWFKKIGIMIHQVYGMTEDCVYSHYERPDEYRFGKVGRPLPGLLTKIADNGEIRIKGPGNLVGYYKEPEMTAEVFDEENYLKTGDMGEYDADGFLTITGRIKDIFKTDKGKYISPAPIEMQILGNPMIEQACVVGTGVPQPIVLITLAEAAKQKPHAELINELTSFLRTVNKDLEKYEVIEKMVIMKESWTIANNLLTPSMKVKRNEVEKIHLPKYPVWYEEKDVIVWEK